MKAITTYTLTISTALFCAVVMYIALANIRPDNHELGEHETPDWKSERIDFKQDTVTVLVESYHSDSQMTG